MRRWSAPQNVFFLCEDNYISIWDCWVGCGDGQLRKMYFFFVKIIIYQSGIVGSDAEMVSSAKCIFLCENNYISILECCVGCGNGPLRKINFFYVKIIIYQSGIVRSDAEMVHSAKYNFFM